MIEAIKEWLWIEPETWDEWLLNILIWLIFLVILFLILFCIVWALNFWFVPIRNAEGVVYKKEYRAAYWTSTVISTGKSTVIVPQHHPESWKAYIECNGFSDVVSISHSDYQTIVKGQRVNVTYQSGRLWGSINIKDFTY